MRRPSNVFIVALGPMIGISCACVYTLAMAQRSMSGPKVTRKASSDEDLSKTFDFPSVERYRSVKEMETRVLRTGTMTGNDFLVVEDTFQNGSSKARAVVIHVCSSLRNQDQIRKIITLSKALTGDTALHQPLQGMLVRFASTQASDQVRQLQSDTDPVIVGLAKKALDENSTSKTSTGEVGKVKLSSSQQTAKSM